VREIINFAANENRDILNAGEVYNILEAYGITTAKWDLCSSISEALKSAGDIGYPLVLKADSKEIIHKSDSGGVVLNIKTEEELRAALVKMASNFDASDLKFFIQQFIAGGKEVIIGANAVQGLGHMIMFGMGGIFVELLKDVSFELTPVSKPEAEEMISSIKTAKILQGFRGDKGVDIPGLVKIIQRVSQLVADHPRILEMDINPLAAFENSISAIDARIKIKI
jgi:acyl-CoA synthetase (NDP forming)